MGKAKVTQKNISTLSDGVYKVDDDLYLRVRGKYKNFFVKIQINGKRKEKGVGSALKTSIANAKIIAKKLRVDAETDEHWNESKKQADIILFDDIYKDVIDATQKTRMWKGDRNKKQWLQSIEDYALPFIGKKSVADIDRNDIYRLLNEIWDEKTETATRLRSRLERIFDYCIFKGYREKANPASWRGNLELMLPPVGKVQEVKHHRAMTMKEAKMITRRFYDSPFTSHNAILFGLLTASRVSEFLLAEWSEIDFKNKIWTCPKERAKTGVEYRFPLSTVALHVLSKCDKTHKLIFPASHGGALHIDSCRTVLQKNVKRAVTMHGCRSTFRDWCAESGVDRIIAEKCLMHKTGNDVEQAYQRSDLIEQRREVLEKWAQALVDL